MPLDILLYFLWAQYVSSTLCPSSGARDYNVVYHIGLVVLGLLYVGGEVQTKDDTTSVVNNIIVASS